MSITSKDYNELDRTALRLRLDYDFIDDYLDIFALAKKLNINLAGYSKLSKDKQKYLMDPFRTYGDGFTVVNPNNKDGPEFWIFYNDSLDINRIRFTIAHEIKHIIYGENSPTEDDEIMADHFARFILAPLCLIVLKYDDYYYPINIEEDFGISCEASINAHKAASRRLFYRDRNIEPHEKEFVDEYIKRNKKLLL